MRHIPCSNTLAVPLYTDSEEMYTPTEQEAHSRMFFQHCSQQPKKASDPNVHEWWDGYRHGIKFTQWMLIRERSHSQQRSQISPLVNEHAQCYSSCINLKSGETKLCC